MWASTGTASGSFRGRRAFEPANARFVINHVMTEGVHRVGDAFGDVDHSGDGIAAFHRDLTDLMNPMLKRQEFKNALPHVQAQMLVDFYRNHGYNAQADVAEAWFRLQNLWQ